LRGKVIELKETPDFISSFGKKIQNQLRWRQVDFYRTLSNEPNNIYRLRNKPFIQQLYIKYQNNESLGRPALK